MHQMPVRRLLMASVLILMLAAGAASYAGTVKHEERLSITTETLAALIRANIPMTIFDARTGSHDDGRRIPGAIQLAPDASADAIGRFVANKDKLIVVYCKDPQCPNFAILAVHLRGLGYKNVLENPEGIEGWAKVFHATIKPARH